jgi:GH35 family endo-1,4-beta-xylanase
MKHFTVLTAGNEQKMETVQPAEGKYDWGIVDPGKVKGLR